MSGIEIPDATAASAHARKAAAPETLKQARFEGAFAAELQFRLKVGWDAGGVIDLKLVYDDNMRPSTLDLIIADLQKKGFNAFRSRYDDSGWNEDGVNMRDCLRVRYVPDSVVAQIRLAGKCVLQNQKV